ncbi:MAG: FAD-dependent thymidylate synthase [Proteobacteria bacterium]|nr:FAD-dependent thymidylate synthase [Pseudomonadota bacterium]
MNIILAGYNLDYEIIKELNLSNPDAKALTPETISAAYARISRNPAPVTELRKIAGKEVEKARKSNRNIVFGMGHSSIAEHAVFNIDVLGVSRFIVEEIEKFRLCSYTEKSQRYILLEDDFVIPDEIRQAGLEEPFVKTIKEQNKFYHELYSVLKPYVFEKYGEMALDPANHSTLDGWAKEDARYTISLATETQLGMTLNARNLELMLRRLAAHPLKEAGEYSRKLYKATKDIAPSLVRYTEATEFDLMTRGDLKEKAKGLIEKWGGKTEKTGNEDVTLLYTTPDADDKTVASLIHSSSNITLEECMAIASSMEREEKEDFIKTACRYMKPYDAALREFENVELLFELTVSATCFAQLKRHRMATITCQDYDPTLGVIIPPTISATGMEGRFMEIISRTEETYNRIKRVVPEAAGYILTNAHKKRVAMKVNARELYHIARLRADTHAQWDIRETAERMLTLGKETMPLTLMLATGKDGFASLYDRRFSR